MPNPNYIKGRKKEYKICKQLRDQGYVVVQRTAGSHSPIDIFAINKEDKEVLFIQSKPDNYTLSKCNKIKNDLIWLQGTFRVYFKLI